MTKVTIGIPVFNGARYLGEALASACEAAGENTEILVVDDGSTDSSASIVSDRAQSDSRLRLVSHDKNLGLGPARNTIIREARGKWLLFLDADDLISPEIITRTLKAIGEAQLLRFPICSWSGGPVPFSDTRGEAVSITSPTRLRQAALGALLPDLQKESFGGSACGALYRTGFLRSYGLWFSRRKECLSEDYLFSFECIAEADNMVWLPDTLYAYRVNPDSKTHRPDPDLIVHAEAYCRELEAVAARHGMVEEGRRMAVSSCVGVVAGLAKRVIGSGIDERQWYERQLESPWLHSVARSLRRDMVPLRWYLVFRAFISGHFRVWRLLVKLRDLARRNPV